MSNAIAAHHTYPASEGERFSGCSELRVVECFTCHVTYAIPESFYRAARKHNKAKDPDNYWSICCPFGHQWHYTGLNREQQLERDLQRQRDHAGWLASQRDQLRSSLTAQRGAATRARNERDRLKQRAAAGVCPCCNRTFKQLARHMKGQHPDWTEGDA